MDFSFFGIHSAGICLSYDRLDALESAISLSELYPFWSELGDGNFWVAE